MEFRKRGVGFALLQIANLVFSVIAIAFLIGIINVGVVSGDGGGSGGGTVSIGGKEINFNDVRIMDNGYKIYYSEDGNVVAVYNPDLKRGLIADDDGSLVSIGKDKLSSSQQPTSTLGLQERLFYFAEDVKDGEYGSFWSLTIGGGTALDAVASAASYAAAAYASIKLFTEIFGIEGEKARNIERAAVIGVGAGKLTSNIMQRFASENFLQGWGGYAPWAVGLAAFAMTYKKQETKIVKFECKPWEPPCSLLAA